jgi:uncharacterized protein YneF (UPF0154 family)
MTNLIIIVSIFFLLQVGIFIISRRMKKKNREHNVIDKYDIRTPRDAWKLMGDQSIPEEDRKKIETLYHGRD